MYAALRATSATLVKYLDQRLQSGSDELAGLFDSDRSGTMVVSLDAPEEMNDREEGLSVWLYRVVRDEQTLNAPRQRHDDLLERKMLPLRLHYLMTPVVNLDNNSTEQGQLILGGVLQAMHDYPLFRGADLDAEFLGTNVEFRVRLETLSMEELAQIWDVLECSYRLSVSYEVSVVNIHSALEPSQFVPVDQARVEAGTGIIVDPGLGRHRP